jgi:hypothetical protein
MRVGFEIAQHRIALSVGLLETIQGPIAFTEPGENKSGEIVRHIIVPLFARFELVQAFARAIRLSRATVGIAKISQEP